MEDIEDTGSKPLLPIEKFAKSLAEYPIEYKTRSDYEKQIIICRRKYHIMPSKFDLIDAYMGLMSAGIIKAPNYGLEKWLIRKLGKTSSGIVSITVLSNPEGFSCAYDCAYCPNEKGMPRSYPSTEPAVMRGIRNGFDPVLQFFDRGVILARNGHQVTKIEALVLGGTWSSHKKEFQREFIRDLYYAANIFHQVYRASGYVHLNGKDKFTQDNKVTYPGDPRPRLSMEEEIRANEAAEARIIGLTLETRPDSINVAEIRMLRSYGCTRVQLGVQHTDNAILELIERRCTIERAILGIRRLIDNGFKVDIHIMPDLPGSSPQVDRTMIDWLIENVPFDQLKIYPCEIPVASHETLIREWYLNQNEVIWIEDRLYGIQLEKGAVGYNEEAEVEMKQLEGELQKFISAKEAVSLIRARQKLEAELGSDGSWDDEKFEYDRKKVYYTPYAETHPEEFKEVLMYFMSKVPPWVRINRVIRDIPTQSILGGNKDVSMRQKLEKEMVERRTPCRCIRCREIGYRDDLNPENARLVERRYRSLDGDEYFLSFEDPDEGDTIYGFLRLRIPDSWEHIAIESLAGAAYIRELHVYGRLIPQGGGGGESQHFGFGSKLMARAEDIASERGIKKMAIIAGVGVREYYEQKHGYFEKDTYMMKKL